MKMKIAILAACAGAVVFAATTCADAETKRSMATDTIHKQTTVRSKIKTSVDLSLPHQHRDRSIDRQRNPSVFNPEKPDPSQFGCLGCHKQKQ